VKLACIDCEALPPTIQKIGINRSKNVYQDYISASYGICLCNIPKDRGSKADQSELFKILYIISLVRLFSAIRVVTDTI
jgi:hypothetical protein